MPLSKWFTRIGSWKAIASMVILPKHSPRAYTRMHKLECKFFNIFSKKKREKESKFEKEKEKARNEIHENQSFKTTLRVSDFNKI